MSKPAILLSGGLDSAALAVMQMPPIGFCIDYGQRCAEAEMRAANTVAEKLSIELHEIRVDCSTIGFGHLSGRPSLPDVSPSPEWWPYRNQILASLAAPVALSLGVTSLLFGAVLSDGFHADGTSDFFLKLDTLMQMQEGSIRVSAPAIEKTSAQLIRDSGAGIEVLGWTHSCHVSNYACGQCRGCEKRALVLREVDL